MSEPIADSFYKGERKERQGEPAHLTGLRDAFPGVWVREDGAFRSDEFGVAWSPGNVEGISGAPNEVARGGLVRFFGMQNYRGSPMPELKLTQLRALTEYVAAESRVAPRPS